MNSCRRQLLGRIRRMMGPEVRDGLESSDILQSVYVEALRGPDRETLAGRKLLPWMTRVARHKIVDEARRRRSLVLEDEAGARRSAESSASLGTQLVRLEDRRVLEAALGALDPERRRVIELRCERGASWEEVARELGRSAEAARKLYHRALVELGVSLAAGRAGPG